jgi:hypothetical protein
MEERFCPRENRDQVHGVGKLVDVFQHLIEMFQVVHYDVAMFLENSECNKKMEAAGEIVRPKGFPQAKCVAPFELALVPNKQHSEKEEKVCAVS